MADVKALAEELVNLTVKDVQELAKVLKEEYGIEPAAAAVAVAGPAAAAADAAPAEGERREARLPRQNNRKRKKVCAFCADKIDEIADYITKDMERGVTALRAVGWYTRTDRLVLMVMLRRTELPELVKSIKELDSKAFVTVVPASNVFGEGFDEIKVGLPRKKKNP